MTNSLAHKAISEQAEAATVKLLAYCRANDWAGYDPYDVLNSKILTALPFFNSRLSRIAVVQAMKRSPINVRRLLLVPKTQNAKAIALFLSALGKLSSSQFLDQRGLIELMIERLIALRSPGTSYWCWGYNFPWQARTILVPAGAPNLVCTSFVAGALLDEYERSQDPRCLDMAVSATEYILNDLYWTDGTEVAGFSYPQPSVQSRTHNANLLAAALLCRVYKHTGTQKYLGPALRVARYSAGKQHGDGSWDYGELSTQRWIDSFHTGFNLCALQSIGHNSATSEFEPSLRRGLEFYRNHFFRDDGAARYFHNRTYPIDIHSVAQGIITLVGLKEYDKGSVPLAHSVFRWAMDHMWDDRGFFYYRVLRLCTIRTSYMRWSQAWMLLALSHLLVESDETTKISDGSGSAVSVEAKLC